MRGCIITTPPEKPLGKLPDREDTLKGNRQITALDGAVDNTGVERGQDEQVERVQGSIQGRRRPEYQRKLVCHSSSCFPDASRIGMGLSVSSGALGTTFVGRDISDARI